MILHKLHVSAFGHLQAYQLDLQPGLQLLYGPNEQGKSTLMAFIRAMFYGFSGAGRRLEYNDRKKYLPWNGLSMGGSLDFEFQNQLYRLERKFGKSKSADKTVLMQGITGQALDLPGNQEPGQALFKMSENEFENTVFVRQLSSRPGTDDTLLTRLSNLAGTGDTAISHKQIDQRLKQAQNTLLAPRGTGGILNEARSKLDILYQQKEQAIEVSRNHLQKIECLSQIKAQLLNNQQQAAALHLRVERHLQVQQLNSWEHIHRLKIKLDETEHLYNQTCQQLTRNGQTADLNYTQKLRRLYSQWKEASVIAADRNQNIIRMKNDLQVFSQTHGHLLIMSQYDKEKETLLLNQLHAAKKAEELQDGFSEMYIQKMNDISNVKAEIQSYEQSVTRIKSERDARLSMMEQEITAAEKSCRERMDVRETLKDAAQKAEKALVDHKNNPPSTKPGQPQLIRAVQTSLPVKISLILSVGVAFASIAAGFFTNFWYFYVLAICVVFGCLTLLFLASIKAAQKLAFHARITWKSQHQQLDNDLRSVVSQLNNYQDLLSASEKNLDDISEKYNDYRRQMSQYLQDIEKEKSKNVIELINKKNQILELIESLTQSLSDLADKFSLPEIKYAIRPEETDSASLVLENLETFQQNIKKLIICLQDKHNQSLSRFDCADWDEMQNKHNQYEQFMLVKKTKELVLKDADIEKEQANQNEKLIIDELADLLKPFYSLIKPDTAIQYIEALETTRHKTDQLQEELLGNHNQLTKLLGDSTFHELKNRADEIRQSLDKIKSPSDNSSQEDIDPLTQRLNQLSLEQTDMRVMIATREEEIRQIAVKQVSVSEIDKEIVIQQEKIKLLEQKYYLLDKARKALDAAADELQNSFGPELNKQTGLILSRLTAGKYDQLKIDRAFMIRLANPDDKHFYEWQYLSGGTIDQVYLALRLAISNAIMSDFDHLPLFLDDVFIQYDLERTNASFQYLKEKSENNQQILFFSCQNHYVNLFENNNCPVVYLNRC